MKILQKENRLIILDTLTGIWIFFFMFVLAGSVMIACPLGLCSDAGPRFEVRDFLSLAAGLIAVFFGVLSIYRHPFTTTEIDTGTGEVAIRQKGLLRQGLTRLSTAEISDVKILEEEGTEGKGHKLHLELKDGKRVPLSSWWAANEQTLIQSAAAIRKALNR